MEFKAMTLALFRLIPLVLAWGGCYGLCRELAARGRIESDRRMSILFACAIWGVLLTSITELSSLFRNKSPIGLRVSIAQMARGFYVCDTGSAVRK